MTITTHAAALTYLLGRVDYERALAVPYGEEPFRLARMRELLVRLGDPQQDLKIVHIAGTKGKGSTAAMIAAVLSAAGYRTGLFTSPHLDRVEERLAIDGHPCSAAELVDLVNRVAPVVEAMDRDAVRDGLADAGPTYFEILTAMALVHFAQRNAKAVVLEVGLGGRLDSTNVCQPVVSVVTSISFDHTRQLGDTLRAIAREKAGIIKPGVPVVSGATGEEPRRVVEEVCRRLGCPLAQLGIDFDFDYRPPRALEAADGRGAIDFRYWTPGREHELRNLALALVGRHQGANASLALAVLAELRRQGWNLPEEAVRRGLTEVVWPARIEVVGRRPTLVLDAAHNVASVAALVEVLDECFAARRRILVFAATQDKDARGMLEILLPRFDEVILTSYANNPRRVPVEELDALAGPLGGPPRRLCPDAAGAWNAVRALAAAEDLVCITGSFYIAAEMRLQIAARPVAYPPDTALESV
ncbi:MAG: bifunctional folylpolyglutamate synthase/dihydrofolate synthase [Pirellulales bacterium]